MEEETHLSLDLRAQPPPEAPETTPVQTQEPPAGSTPLSLVITRWLPALGVAAVAVVLAPRLLDYVQHSWDVLRFPWQLDFDEGVNLNASWLLSQGTNIYKPNPPDHFVSAMYPPLYFALNAVAIKLGGLNLFSGRLLAFLGALGVGATLWAWIYVETKRHLAGALAALLWFSLGPVYVWSTFYKQDMLALAFGLAGAAMAARHFANERLGVPPNPPDKALPVTPQPLTSDPRPLYWAIIPLALAFWTKQSTLAPMAAVGLCLLARDWRLAVRWGLVAAGAVVVPFALLDLLTKGGLHTHVFAFEYYGRSAARVAKNMGVLWSEHWPLILCVLFALVAIVQGSKFKVQGLNRVPLDFIYLIVSVPAVLLSNSLPTANYNHLLDILAPLCLVAGMALGRAGQSIALVDKPSNSLLVTHYSLLVGVLVLALAQAIVVYNKPGQAWYTPLGMPLAERAGQMEKLSALVKSTPGDMLSEDTWLLLKNGKRVLYDDPAAMTALANAGAWDQSVLLQDLNRRKFSLVLLEYDITNETYNPRWTNQTLQALQANYQIRFRDVLFAHAPQPAPEQPQSVAGCDENGPILEGYTFRATSANHGDNLPLSLYWRKREGANSDNIKFFVRLVDEAGVPRWSADLPPGQAAGRPVPSVWGPDETVRDDLTIPIAPDLPFGRYRLTFGKYAVDGAGKIRPLVLGCANMPMDNITLANIEVVERWGK